jgi:hypothetical protein
METTPNVEAQTVRSGSVYWSGSADVMVTFAPGFTTDEVLRIGERIARRAGPMLTLSARVDRARAGSILAQKPRRVVHCPFGRFIQRPRLGTTVPSPRSHYPF